MKRLFKNKKLLSSLLMLPILVSLSGCIYLVVGGLGAVGGYVVSPDTVEGITENEMIDVWDAAVEIVSIMGTIEEQHEDGGVLMARVNKADVTITITTLNANTSKIRVKSRKFLLPKISVAQDVFVKIMTYLNE